MSTEQQQPSEQPGTTTGTTTNEANQSESTNIQVPEENQQSGQQPTSNQASGEQQTGQSDQQDLAASGYGYGIFRRHIRYDPLSILFTILVFVGGIVGYVSKESHISLISGTVFAIALAVGTYFEGARKNPFILIITTGLLGSLMLYRYSQSMSFMPSGLVALLSFLMFARHCYLFYLRRQTRSQA